MNPDVGIILPVYNGIPFLGEAFDRLLAQSCAHWQLYLVDDSSTDGSREWIERCSDPRFHKEAHPRNLGLYPTLLQVIQQIPNEWIVILMQDDRLKPHFLREMLGLAECFPGVRAFSAASEMIDEHGRLCRAGDERGRIELVEPGKAVWYNGMLRGAAWTISSSFTHRDLFADIPFRSDLPHAADYDWYLRVVRRERMVRYGRSLTQLRAYRGQASARNQATDETSASSSRESCAVSRRIDMARNVGVLCSRVAARQTASCSEHQSRTLYGCTANLGIWIRVRAVVFRFRTAASFPQD